MIIYSISHMYQVLKTLKREREFITTVFKLGVVAPCGVAWYSKGVV